MLPRTTLALFTLILGVTTIRTNAADLADAELEQDFTRTVRPFLEGYCISCHGGEKPKADFDLNPYSNLAMVIRDHAYWALILEKLEEKEMPPSKAEKHPDAESREQVIEWIEAMRKNEARKNAGDPGVVLVRRLSNAEYNYSIQHLTGVENLRPAREFPVDPANLAGFDNSGESLAMSPSLLNKYLLAAREVASHLVLKLDGITFASHPTLVETDRDKFCVEQIMDLYRRQSTNYTDYFEAAWRFKHRAALGQSAATLSDIAAQSEVSPKYLATVWSALEEAPEDIGPLAKLQSMWRELPVPGANQSGLARPGCVAMRDFVVQLRAKVQKDYPNQIGSIRGQPGLMWRNRQYARNRRNFDRDALQVEGETKANADRPRERRRVEVDELDEAGEVQRGRETKDSDLSVPAGQRERYEAAFARFCDAFPDCFYISERGRYFPDNTRDTGRHLSAGFHNVMGYFRDDQPLYEMILSEAEQKELDQYWLELDFIASANIRTYTEFFINDSGQYRQRVERAATNDAAEAETASSEEEDIYSEAMIRKIADNFAGRAREGGNEEAVKAVEEHFELLNSGIRWVQQALLDTIPVHLEAIQAFAERAFRRPLSRAERDDLAGFYHSLRNDAGLSHEQAMRDLVVNVLMAPDFCYRLDLVADGAAPQPLSDYDLANRLSYFLWSSLPDDELLARAAAGELRQPEVLAAQTRRMLKDERAKAMALEFGGNWLDFRRFEELNTVDRERFSSFDDELRQAMFEEPVRFILNVIREDRSVLDFLYADHTFVNPVLAKHYGMPEPGVAAGEWVRVDDANRYQRGGLLPMAAFLTKNAPGLRTSPVKRGYWVVKQVLGEHIPPPPAAVPELPRDEAKMDLPLRETLARHREDPSCSSCHARFDSLGLVFEGYGPVGELREQDLAGRPVDASATFPGGSEGSGIEGLRKYVREHRQGDFIDSLCRKMLAYGLGRSLMLSDDPTIESMRAKLEADDFRFSSLVESIVNSPQFLTKRGDTLAQN